MKWRPTVIVPAVFLLGSLILLVVYHPTIPFPGGNTGECYSSLRADMATLTVLDIVYAKDAGHVYMQTVDQCLVVPGADPRTFMVLNSSTDDYAKDANHVWWSADLLPGADAKTFIALDPSYGKDKSNVYFENQILQGADTSTFAVFSNTNGWFAKDAVHIFAVGKIIPEADPSSFSIQDGYTSSGKYYNAKDKNHYYFYNQIVQ